MRLDKFLSETNTLIRKDAKAAIKSGLITVNGIPATDSSVNISEEKDEIRYKNRIIPYLKNITYALNKPAGYVCSLNEADGIPVHNLLPPELRKRLNPIGRLDKNTTGLLLFTDDGDLAHSLLSPKNHVEKTYLVNTLKPVTDEDKNRLKDGVNLGDGEVSLPAKIMSGKDDFEIILTICEGKYHQVKRMMQATCNKVTALKRISFGGLTLENMKLNEGEGKILSEAELSELRLKGSK